MVPEMEPKVLHILGKLSATQSHPQTFVDYKTDSHYVTQAVLELKIPQLSICWDSTIPSNENCINCFEDKYMVSRKPEDNSE